VATSNPFSARTRLLELAWLEIQTWVNSLHDENGAPLAASSVTK
jgi:hypothetical protein